MFKDIVREDKSLRPYQQTAKEEIFAAWDDCDSVMFQMPTGTGKTRLFTCIISDIKAWGILAEQDPKILIIAHRVELIEQISENLDRYKVTHGIIAGGKERNLRSQIKMWLTALVWTLLLLMRLITLQQTPIKSYGNFILTQKNLV